MAASIRGEPRWPSWTHRFWWCHHWNIMWLLWSYPPLYRSSLSQRFQSRSDFHRVKTVIMAQAQLALLCCSSETSHPQGGQDLLLRMPSRSPIAASPWRLPHDGRGGVHQVLFAGGSGSAWLKEGPSSVPPLFLVFKVPPPSGLRFRACLDQSAVGRWGVVWCCSAGHP